jgi:hypothetical protein
MENPQELIVCFVDIGQIVDHHFILIRNFTSIFVIVICDLFSGLDFSQISLTLQRLMKCTMIYTMKFHGDKDLM